MRSRTGAGTRPLADTLETAGTIAFCMAIATSPLVIRCSLLPTAVSPCDILVALSASLFIAASPFRVTPRDLSQVLRPVLPLIAVTVLSALASENARQGVPDTLQLCLYGGVATCLGWRVSNHDRGYRLLRLSMACALAISVLGLLLHLELAAVAPVLFSAAAPLALLPAVFVSLLIAMSPPAGRRFGVALRGMLVVLALICFVFLPVARPAQPPQAISELRSPVPQRYLEAYAAATVLAKWPLLGLGPGNYQAHIGEYYQSLPKDNTLASGTQVGYAVVAASAGILGLAATLFWVLSLWGWVRAGNPRDNRLLIPLALWALAVWFTPPFVSPMLMPMAVMHGLAWRRARSCAT